MYNISMEKQRSGFTLLETVLVLAIATLLFMSVTIGIGSRISNGRYETANNEIANFLRDVYAETLNTENARVGLEGARKYCTLSSAIQNTIDSPAELFIKHPGSSYAGLNGATEANLFPGRTNCAIYGKVIFFGVKGDEKIHDFDIVGNVVTAKKDANGETDLDRLSRLEGGVLAELNYVHADFLAAIPRNEHNLNDSCKVSPAGGHATYQSDWGAVFQTANAGNGRDKGSPFIGMVMIVRSPLNGDVSTFFYERPSGKGEWEFIEQYIDNNAYTLGGCGPFGTNIYNSIISRYSPVPLIEQYQKDQALAAGSGTEDKNTGFCIGSDDFYIAISGRRKYIEFVANGQNATAVKLNETDIVDPSKEDYNPCQ